MHAIKFKAPVSNNSFSKHFTPAIVIIFKIAISRAYMLVADAMHAAWQKYA